jgi:hypothetical protein
MFETTRVLESWVRVLLIAGMFVCCVCCVGSGVCDELNARSNELCRVCVCVCVCVCTRARVFRDLSIEAA